MAANDSRRRRIAAEIAITERWHGPDSPRATDLRRELKVVGLAEHIRQVVDSAPPLTAEDAARLRALLPAPDCKGGQDAA